MKTNATDLTLLLVGDSDISNWPTELFPMCPPKTKLVSNSVGGAKLSDVVSMVHASITNITNKESKLVTVVCAGENDISSGRTVTKTLSYFTEFLNNIFNDYKKLMTPRDNHSQCNLIFFGPKLEPWLRDDFKYRKKYQELSDGMKKICHNHPNSKSIVFLDCLHMFCAKSKTDILIPPLSRAPRHWTAWKNTISVSA